MAVGDARINDERGVKNEKIPKTMEMWNNKWFFKYDKYTLQDMIELVDIDISTQMGYSMAS